MRQEGEGRQSRETGSGNWGSLETRLRLKSAEKAQVTTRNLVVFYDPADTEGCVFCLVIVQKGMSVKGYYRGLLTCNYF